MVFENSSSPSSFALRNQRYSSQTRINHSSSNNNNDYNSSLLSLSPLTSHYNPPPPTASSFSSSSAGSPSASSPSSRIVQQKHHQPHHSTKLDAGTLRQRREQLRQRVQALEGKVQSLTFQEQDRQLEIQREQQQQRHEQQDLLSLASTASSSSSSSSSSSTTEALEDDLDFTNKFNNSNTSRNKKITQQISSRPVRRTSPSPPASLTVFSNRLSYHQDTWVQSDCSRAVFFRNGGQIGILMPHEQDKGRYTISPGIYNHLGYSVGIYSQSISIRGIGATYIGFVSTDEEKLHVQLGHWNDVPTMKPIELLHWHDYKNDSTKQKSLLQEELTIMVTINMLERTAQLYYPSEPIQQLSQPSSFSPTRPTSNSSSSSNTATTGITTKNCTSPTSSSFGSSCQLQPTLSWSQLPEMVWIAVAMERMTERQIVLLPRIHWEPLFGG